MKELIDKYFEGLTSCEEEAALRHFFTEGDVPEDLEVYRPMFAYFQKEHRQLGHKRHVVNMERPLHNRRALYHVVTAVAACLLLFVGVSHLLTKADEPDTNYVVIDGKYYTDYETTRKEALLALSQVQMDEDEVFDVLFGE